MINFIQVIITRAFLAIITLLAVSFIVFALMELVPANCAERYLAFKNTQGSNISIEEINARTVCKAKAVADHPRIKIGT